MQFLAFVWSRLPDPYAIMVGVAVGLFAREWWQTVLGGLAGGIAMAFAFGLITGMSRDAALYFLVDAAVVAMWASAVFYLRRVVRERRRLKRAD